jgi:hypothetical protein
MDYDMKKQHKAYLAIISAILLTLIALPAYAQNPDILTAEVDRSEITTDEYVNLSVNINLDYGSTSEPALPPLDGFDLVGTSTSTSMSIINGVQSTQKIFQYTLRPTKLGELVIGPVSVNINGQSFNTSPLKVNVIQGNGQPSTRPAPPSFPGIPSAPGFPSLSGLFKSFGFDIPFEFDGSVEQLDPSSVPSELLVHDFWVEAEVDNPSPYMGEQVTYTFRYFRPADSVGRHSYQEPEFTGFWVHPESGEKQFGTQVAGRNIHMTEIKTVLLPTVVGEVEIEPAMITSEGDIFSSGFAIQTLPQKIMVQPLPDGAPNGFTGAVGNFSISAEVDQNETKVNDAVTLNITISGEGNLETFADPEWQTGPQWRAFNSQSATNTQSQDGKLVGTRSINQVLVPTMPGKFTIPAIQFSFFDPQSASYQTISTNPIQINIESDGQLLAPVVIEDDPTLIASLGQIRPIKDSSQSKSNPSLLTQKVGFWLLWTLPLLMLVGQYGWHKRKQYLMNNPEAKRSQKAAKKASQALKNVDINSNDYYNSVGRILTTYISDKLNRSVAGLTQAELSGLLLAQGVNNNLVEQVRTCLTISEMGQYAPTHQMNPKEVHLETKSLIAELEKVL